MAILDVVRLRIRTTTTSFDDDEIIPLIAAAKIDLKGAGVAEAKIIDTDPIIEQAIVLYCKANFGMDNAMMEKYQISYNNAKAFLAINLDYSEQGA